uniref:Peptidase C1A papain C-terminal domain-containing protein n=1 Tax=Oryza rufipogon TaxID=4529 RepID=A0A0E0NTR8_ORYRU
MASRSFRRLRDSPWTAHFYGAHAAVESFESRARIKLAKRGIGGFPTLSIQHLIDILRDQLDDAPNLNQKRLVMMEENAFRILKNIGVTTKEAYDAAPLGTGFVKNVEGLPNYKIENYRVLYLKSNCWHEGASSEIIDAIHCGGPVYGWFAFDDSFQDAKGEIYRVPSAPSTMISPIVRTHALLLYGYGAQGRTGLFDYQNNWGPEYHNGGRGIMESANIIGTIVPDVTFAGIAF